MVIRKEAVENDNGDDFDCHRHLETQRPAIDCPDRFVEVKFIQGMKKKMAE
jgi:hypothetical protein